MITVAISVTGVIFWISPDQSVSGCILKSVWITWWIDDNVGLKRYVVNGKRRAIKLRFAGKQVSTESTDPESIIFIMPFSNKFADAT